MVAAVAQLQLGNFDCRGISFRGVNPPFFFPDSSHQSFLSVGSTSPVLSKKEKLTHKLWPNKNFLRFGFVIPRSSGSSGSSDTADESSSQAKTPFGYTRKDVLLIGLGVMIFGVALKSGLEFAGVDPLQAGNVVQLLVVLGMTLGWISTYMFRVANKDMTYAQQLRDYENKVMEKRLEGLTEAELQVLLEQVEEEKRRNEQVN